MSRDNKSGDEAAHMATIDRWRRKKEQAEDAAEHMTAQIRKGISKALVDGEQKRKIAIDLNEATKNRHSQYNKGEGGFGVYDDGEIITGWEKYTKDD